MQSRGVSCAWGDFDWMQSDWWGQRCVSIEWVYGGAVRRRSEGLDMGWEVEIMKCSGAQWYLGVSLQAL